MKSFVLLSVLVLGGLLTSFAHADATGGYQYPPQQYPQYQQQYQQAPPQQYVPQDGYYQYQQQQAPQLGPCDCIVQNGYIFDANGRPLYGPAYGPNLDQVLLHYKQIGTCQKIYAY